MKGYNLLHPIGSVGRSAVFLADDLKTKKQVAIKLFSNLSKENQEKLLKDAQILKTIQHPNLVRILDFGLDEDVNVYYVMEYLQGRPLQDLVTQEHGLNLTEVFEIMSPLCDAISTLHENGLLHLDIKPNNILMVKNQPKLLDFGWITPESSDSFIGTPGYIAPEIILHQQVPNAQSDIYSLGALLAFLCTGHKLFEGTSPENVLAQQFHKPNTQELPPELAKIIQRATQQHPKHRYKNSRDFLKALSSVLQPNEQERLNTSLIETSLAVVMLLALISITIAIYHMLLSSV